LTDIGYNMEIIDRRKKTEDRRRKTEERRQKTEERRKKKEVEDIEQNRNEK
jgi:hypothetical protein